MAGSLDLGRRLRVRAFRFSVTFRYLSREDLQGRCRCVAMSCAYDRHTRGRGLRIWWTSLSLALNLFLESALKNRVPTCSSPCSQGRNVWRHMEISVTAGPTAGQRGMTMQQCKGDYSSDLIRPGPPRELSSHIHISFFSLFEILPQNKRLSPMCWVRDVPGVVAGGVGCRGAR